MTTMTFASAATGEQDPYYAGRADAYDDARTLTAAEISVRAAHYTAHLDVMDLMYVLGYTDRLLEQRSEDAMHAAAQIELAWTPLPAVTQ